MTIELRSYDLSVAELVIIAKCIADHPDANGVTIAKILGMSKSNFYLKVKQLSDPDTRHRLIDLGYTLQEVIILSKITSIS